MEQTELIPAIVIDHNAYRETSVLLKLLTAQRGSVSALVYGFNSKSQTYPSTLSRFNIVSVRLDSAKSGFATLREVQLVLPFDMQRVTLPVYGFLNWWFEIMAQLAVDAESSAQSYRMSQQLLQLISHEGKQTPITKLIDTINELMKWAGLDLSNINAQCSTCNEHKTKFADIENGTGKCEHCTDPEEQLFPYSHKPDDLLFRCALAEEFLQHHIGVCLSSAKSLREHLR